GGTALRGPADWSRRGRRRSWADSGRRRSATTGLRLAGGDRLERQQITPLAEADDRGDGIVSQEVHAPERLARRGIGQVDLPERPRDAEQGVAQGDRRVGQAAPVDDRDDE